jgi:hypothetical protein
MICLKNGANTTNFSACSTYFINFTVLLFFQKSQNFLYTYLGITIEHIGI